MIRSIRCCWIGGLCELLNVGSRLRYWHWGRSFWCGCLVFGIGLFVSLDFLVFLVFGGFSVSCCDIVTFRGNIFSLFTIVLLVYPSLLVWECFQ